MRFICLLLTGFLVTFFAHAQIGYGPEVGLNISDYYGKAAGKKISTDVKYGGMFGANVEIELTDHFFLLPGLFNYRNGYTTPHSTGTSTIAINTIEIPVNIEYKFGPPERVKFFVGLGPYVGINYGGTLITSAPSVYSTRDVYIGSTADNDIKRIDVGMAGWGVYQITRGLFFRARYQHGILNMRPSGDANNTLRNYSFSLSAGYMFPGDLKARNEPQIEEDKAAKKEHKRCKKEHKQEEENKVERESGGK